MGRGGVKGGMASVVSASVEGRMNVGELKYRVRNCANCRTETRIHESHWIGAKSYDDIECDIS